MERLRKIPFVILLLPLVAAIIVYYAVNENAENFSSDEKTVWQAELLSIPQLREKTVKAEARLVWRDDSVYQIKKLQKVVLYISRDTLSEKLKVGDRLLIYGKIGHFGRGNPYEFDYDKWLRRKGVAGTIFLDENEWLHVGEAEKISVNARAEMLRHKLVNLLRESGLSEQEVGVVAAMTVGEKEELDRETRRKYSAAGASHVLAVSGLHTGIVFAIILNLLTVFGYFPILYKQKKRKIIVNIIGIIFIWLYAFLTGMSPSVMRAALMITLFYGADALGRQQVPINTLAAAAFLNLLIEPQALWSVSFQLSYGAVLGILIFYRKLERILFFKSKPVRWVWQLLVLSVSAQLGTLPATLWYFQQTSNYFALTNLFVIPLAELIIVFTMLLVLLAATPLKVVAQYPLKWCAIALNKVVGWIESLPGSTSNLSITIMMLVMLITAIALLGVWLHKDKWQYGVSVVVALLLIVFLHIKHIDMISKTEQTVVYNTYPYSLILHQQGRGCTLYSDSVDAALMISEPLRKQMMIKHLQTVDLNDKEVATFLCDTNRYLWLSPQKGHKIVFDNSVSADVLLFAGRGNQNASEAMMKSGANKVIMLSSLPEWRREKIRESAIANHLDLDSTFVGAVKIDRGTN